MTDAPKGSRPGCLIIYPATEASSGAADESPLCLCAGGAGCRANVRGRSSSFPHTNWILISQYAARGSIYTHVLRRAFSRTNQPQDNPGKGRIEGVGSNDEGWEKKKRKRQACEGRGCEQREHLTCTHAYSTTNMRSRFCSVAARASSPPTPGGGVQPDSNRTLGDVPRGGRCSKYHSNTHLAQTRPRGRMVQRNSSVWSCFLWKHVFSRRILTPL